MLIDIPEVCKANQAQREQEIVRCPLCEEPMQSLWKTRSLLKKGFHYWCGGCNHGWHIADIQNFIGMCLAGKKEKAIQIIKESDLREEN